MPYQWFIVRLGGGEVFYLYILSVCAELILYIG